MIEVDELKNYPKSVLVDIFNTMNFWEWHPCLGDKPERWDELPNYKKPWMDECALTKADIIRPYMREIRNLTGNVLL